MVYVAEDRLPPSVIVNKGLVLDENSVKKITTLQLSATDQDSEPGDLVYSITKQTQLGRLEHAASPGARAFFSNVKAMATISSNGRNTVISPSFHKPIPKATFIANTYRIQSEQNTILSSKSYSVQE